MDPIKVYVVEDDDVILKALKKFLQNWSYEVHVADDFSSVYEKFLKVNPDLVLLDVSCLFLMVIIGVSRFENHLMSL